MKSGFIPKEKAPDEIIADPRRRKGKRADVDAPVA